jgi:hypothetical protein
MIFNVPMDFLYFLIRMVNIAGKEFCDLIFVSYILTLHTYIHASLLNFQSLLNIIHL